MIREKVAIHQNARVTTRTIVLAATVQNGPRRATNGIPKRNNGEERDTNKRELLDKLPRLENKQRRLRLDRPKSRNGKSYHLLYSASIAKSKGDLLPSSRIY